MMNFILISSVCCHLKINVLEYIFSGRVIKLSTICNIQPPLSSAELTEQLKRERDAWAVDPVLHSEALMVLLWAEHRMPYHCVAYGCGKTTEDGVTLFKFPKDPEEFRKWEKQVQRTRAQWVATPNSYLCSEHFGKEYFEPRLSPGALKLRPGAAPTVFVRPHCFSCNGLGCSKCLPAIQRRSITSETRERSISVSS